MTPYSDSPARLWLVTRDCPGQGNSPRIGSSFKELSNSSTANSENGIRLQNNSFFKGFKLPGKRDWFSSKRDLSYKDT
ncbi:hypothetical protein SK128_017361, partial [Halocaridina rubra]